MVGHATGLRCEDYIADRYSLEQGEEIFRNPLLNLGDEHFPVEPAQRDLGEQAAKALGDVAGLGANLIFVGIPQLVFLGRNHGALTYTTSEIRQALIDGSFIS